MKNSRHLLTLLKIWFVERKGAIYAVIGAFFLSIIFLIGSLPMNVKNVSGIAHAQVLGGSLTGNKPKLAVKLEDGSMAYVGVDSPSQVKVGKKVCLNKRISYLGVVNFSIIAMEKCT